MTDNVASVDTTVDNTSSLDATVAAVVEAIVSSIDTGAVNACDDIDIDKGKIKDRVKARYKVYQRN